MTKLKLFALIFLLLVMTYTSYGQTDSAKAERDAVKQEMMEMNEKINSYLSDKTSSNESRMIQELNKKWSHFADSVKSQLAMQQLEIADLKARLKALEEKKPETPEVVTTKFDNVLAVLYFDMGSYTLSTENKATIKKIVQEHGNKILQLVAYTDWIGNNEYNQNLSNQRAKSVQDELTSLGFLIQNMRIYSRGKMADENEKLSAKECRRVEIRF